MKRKMKLSDFTDLTKEELKLVANGISRRSGRLNYLFGFLYEEQILKYIATKSENSMLELASLAIKKGLKLNNYETTINTSIIWLMIMNNEITRNIFNKTNQQTFLNVKPFSDMNDIYIFLLEEYFVNNREVSNINLLKDKYFRNIKKANMRKNFKTFLDNYKDEESR